MNTPLWNRWPQNNQKQGKLVGDLIRPGIVCKAACYTPNREAISIHTQASAVINTGSGMQEREE